VLDERGRAQQILENLHDGVIECDLVNHRHLYANARFCELVGMSVDQVLSAPWPGPWWGPETRAAITAFSDPAWHDQRADDADDCLDAEQTLSRPDGTTLPVRVNICAIERSASTLAVALVHDLSRAHARDDELATARRELALVTDRERIARNLHDTAIQRLYATGLHLQSALNRNDIDERVGKAIDEIDEIIREIRTSIFTLQVPRTLLEGLERAVRSTVAEAARVLGFQPQLSITGDLDMVPSDVAYEVLAVTRELLTNIAKHASARHTWVAVAHDVHGVTLTVTDDGVGYQPVAGRAGRGVGNLLARAQAQGGTCVMSPYEPSGTTVSWWVPLDASCTPAQFEVAP
jgi:PAS domain S-box-containing protein